MRRSLQFIVVAATCVGAWACGDWSGAPGARGVSSLSSDVPAMRWVARLQPQTMLGTLTGIFGEVDLKPDAIAGVTIATVNIEGAPPGEHLAWVIRSGACGDVPDRDLGLTASYRWLDVRGDGTASLQVTLPNLLLNQEAHVEIFAGPSELRPVVACGRLVPT